MKCFILTICFIINGFVLTFGQDNASSFENTSNYDSLWYFHAFSIDLAVGVWTPIGKLSTYYSPSYQFGGSLGIITGPKTRLQLWIIPRLFDSKKELPLVDSDMNTYSKTDKLGASIGGSFSRRAFQNKWMCTEINAGVSWESIPVVIKMPNQENDSLHISGIGISIGFNTWINTFKRLNFGLRGVYTYSTFNSSSYITEPIGNHLCSLSIIYRFPRRKIDWERWY